MCLKVPSLITCTTVFADSFWTWFIFTWLPRGATRRNIKLKCLYCPALRWTGIAQPGPSGRAGWLTFMTSWLDTQWRVPRRSFRPMEYVVWVMAGSGWLSPHPSLRGAACCAEQLVTNLNMNWCDSKDLILTGFGAERNTYLRVSLVPKSYIRYQSNVMQSLDNYNDVLSQYGLCALIENFRALAKIRES